MITHTTHGKEIPFKLILPFTVCQFYESFAQNEESRKNHLGSHLIN